MITALSRRAAARAAPLAARSQQRRGFINWMVNYPDKVRPWSGGGRGVFIILMTLNVGAGAEGISGPSIKGRWPVNARRCDPGGMLP